MELPIQHVEPGPEMRRWARHKVDVRLKVSFPNEGKTTSAFGRGNSLSPGGIGAYIPCTIPIGTTVSLELTFPYSDNEVKLNAIIRSCEGFRYGLEFTQVPEEAQATIIKSCRGSDLVQ